MEQKGRPNIAGLRVKNLSPAAQKFLDSKKASTKNTYKACLRRFKAFYPRDLDGYIAEIEADLLANQGKPLAEKVRPERPGFKAS